MLFTEQSFLKFFSVKGIRKIILTLLIFICFNDDKRFKILHVARNLFHLCPLEAAAVIKTSHPVLYRICLLFIFVYSSFLRRVYSTFVLERSLV